MKPKEVSFSEIESKIFLINGQKVLLDSDLAELYQVSTGRLNEQVRRNLKRFPGDFMFSLKDYEVARLISQFAISKTGRGGRRKPSLAFTEQGVAMLSSVLNSDRAIDVNVAIMRTFVKLREVVELDRGFEKKLTALEAKYDGKFQLVFKAIRDLMSQQHVPRKRIVGFEDK